jgi:hypothetical protein
MSSSVTIDRACGAYELAFALFHLSFPKLLRWGKELPKISKDNAGVMQILNLCLTFKFVWSTYIYWTCNEDLKWTKLGKSFKLGQTIFWALRFVEQFIYLNVKHPVHQLLTVIFGSGALLHGYNFMLHKGE